MTEHKCTIITLYSKATLILGVFIYFVDIALDIKVSHYMFIEGDPIWGAFVLIISIISLIITNGTSRSKRFDRMHFYLPDREDVIFNISSCRKYSFRGYFCPWKWDSRFHKILNILSILQLNTIIDIIEIIFHKKQSFRSIALKYAHCEATKKMHKMLVNSILVCLQTLSLVRFYANKVTNVTNKVEDYQMAIRFASLIASCIGLSYTVASEEKARRYAEFCEYDSMIKYGVQTAILFLGYLSIYTSRVLIVALIYYHFIETTGSSSLNYFSVVSIECHHWIIVIIYLLFSIKSNVFNGIVVAKRRPIWILLPMFYILSVSEIFVVNLRFPVRTVGLVLRRTPEKALGHRSKLVFGCHYLLFGIELALIFIIKQFVSKSSQLLLSELCYASLLLFVCSAVMFILYFHPNINPDCRKEKHIHKYYMKSLISITCDIPTKKLPPLDTLQSTGKYNVLPRHFGEFVLAEEPTIEHSMSNDVTYDVQREEINFSTI